MTDARSLDISRDDVPSESSDQLTWKFMVKIGPSKSRGRADRQHAERGVAGERIILVVSPSRR